MTTTYRLPLFPLGLVLFPGAEAPLHIFEPRYRRLLTDVVAGDGRFGLIAPLPDRGEADLSPGRVGAVARVTAVERYPDGRADIVVSGVERFVFERWVDDPAPYRVAEVAAHADLAEAPDTLAPAAMRVRELATRALIATLTIKDVERVPTPLAGDPAALSFQVASMLALDLEDRYALLESRRAGDRLALLEARLGAGVRGIEARAELHERAKTNGHHHGPIPD